MLFFLLSPNIIFYTPAVFVLETELFSPLRSSFGNQIAPDNSHFFRKMLPKAILYRSSIIIEKINHL